MHDAGSWVVQESIKGTARVHAIKWYPPYYPYVLSQRENNAQLANIRVILQTPYRVAHSWHSVLLLM